MKAAAENFIYENKFDMEEVNMSKADVDKKTLLTWLGIIGIPLLVALIPTGESFTLEVKIFFVVTEIAKGRKFNPASVISVIKKGLFCGLECFFHCFGNSICFEMIIFPAI